MADQRKMYSSLMENYIPKIAPSPTMTQIGVSPVGLAGLMRKMLAERNASNPYSSNPYSSHQLNELQPFKTPESYQQPVQISQPDIGFGGYEPANSPVVAAPNYPENGGFTPVPVPFVEETKYPIEQPPYNPDFMAPFYPIRQPVAQPIAQPIKFPGMPEEPAYQPSLPEDWNVVPEFPKMPFNPAPAEKPQPSLQPLPENWNVVPEFNMPKYSAPRGADEAIKALLAMLAGRA